MYKVIIINDNEETIINEVNTENTANRISGGTIKQGINSFDSFTFTIFKNNKGFNKIHPFITRIKVLNTKTNKYEFIGRALPPETYMDESGICGKKFTCESELAFLVDSIQEYKELNNYTIVEYLKKILEVHNLNLTDKKIELGEVSVKDNNDNIYKQIEYATTWDIIKKDLIETLGGEVRLRYEGDKRYLDYLTEIGRVSDTDIRLGKNMKSISEKPDVENNYTRIKFYGAKKKIKNEAGEETDSEERISIETVNNGKKYLDYKEGIEQYGIIEGIVTYDDVTEPSNLLEKGKEYISSLKFSISNTISALDLSLINLDIDSFEVGNYHRVINELLDINYFVRIVEKTIYIDNPQQNSITLGDNQFDMKKYYLEKDKGLEKNLNETQKSVIEINNKVGKLEKNLNENIQKIESIKENEKNYITIENLNLILETINTNFETLENSIKDINKKIDEINIKLSELEGGATNG